MLRRVAIRGLLLGVVALLALASLGAGPPAGQQVPGSHAPDRILVKFKAGTDAATAASVHRQNGGVVLKTIPQIGVQVVGVGAGNVAARVTAYGGNGHVEYAEPDFIAEAVQAPSGKTPPGKTPPTEDPPEATAATNDPLYLQQWGLPKIKASLAWDLSKGDGVLIAILDTGVDQDHPDLAGKIDANQRNFTTSSTVDDVYGHGTHVAGIAAAVTNNAAGVAGTGYNAKVLNGKVLGDNGGGYYSWIAEGLTWAADSGARVANLSLGGSFGSAALESAVNYAWGRGTVVVAAAGNSGSSAKFYPAAYTNAIAVAATDSKDKKASFSNFGSKWVDVAAPGVSILSTTNNGSYASWSGTSMATPFVSGTAALVWASSHGTSAGAVRSRIESGADRIAGTGKYWYWGRINAYNAVK